MDVDDLEVMAWLAQHEEHSEIYRERTYSIERQGPRGRHTICLTIRDAGPHSDPNLRYQCSAVSVNGKQWHSKPVESLNAALSGVNWKALD